MKNYQIIFEVETFDDEGRQINFEVIEDSRVFDNYDEAERERKSLSERTPRRGWSSGGATETIVGLREIEEED